MLTRKFILAATIATTAGAAQAETMEERFEREQAEVKQVMCAMRQGQVQPADLAGQEGGWLFWVRSFMSFQGVEIESTFDDWSDADAKAVEEFLAIRTVEDCGEELSPEEEAEKERQEAERKAKQKAENEAMGCNEGEPIAQLATMDYTTEVTGPPKEFAATVTEALDGTMCMKAIPGGLYFLPDSIAEMVAAGEHVQLGHASLDLAHRYFPTEALMLFDAPFIFDDSAALAEFGKTEEAQALLDSIREHGLVGLAIVPGPMVHLSSVGPVRTETDLEGLNTYTKARKATVELLGANPTPIAGGDLKLALEVGAIKAVSATLAEMRENDWIVDGGVTLTGHAVTGDIIFAGETWWDGLAPEAQQAILDAATSVAEARAGEINAEEEALVQALEGAGHTVTRLSDAERGAIAEAVVRLVDPMLSGIDPAVVEAARSAGGAE